jgi:ribosomal protein S6--L-glutamate ligase
MITGPESAVKLTMNNQKIALAPFLRSCTAIITLGIRATIDDYSPEEKHLLRAAARIFFPTPRYAYLFNAMQIPTFPGHTTYRFQRSRLLQEILLAYLGMPHPATRICFGSRQKAGILKAFAFPFIATGPLAAQHKHHLVDNLRVLEECSRCYNPLIIREAVTWRERLRILCIHGECVGALWKMGSDVSRFDYEPVPVELPLLQSILDLTRDFVRRVKLDDIVIEWGHGNDRWQLLEMMRPPARWPTPKGILNRHHYIGGLVESGRL